MGVGCSFFGTSSINKEVNDKSNSTKDPPQKLQKEISKEIMPDLSLFASKSEIIITFKEQTKSFIYANNKNMKELFERFASKININIKKIFFLYNNYIIKETDSFTKIANKEDKKRDKMNIVVIDKIKLYEYRKNKFYIFNKNPNFKAAFYIYNTNDKGINDIFEVFLSVKDNTEYLVVYNKKAKSLNIYQLLYNKLVLSLYGHTNNVTSIRYFFNNKSYDEYLISADSDKIVIIWDITKNYEMKYKINTFYSKHGLIYSCLLVFPNNQNDDYIITSIDSCEHFDNEKTSTKIYSLNNGEFIKDIKNTSDVDIYYLLSWYNKIDKNFYIIQLGNRKIIISNLLNDELYSLSHEPEHCHNHGLIYSKDNTDYLCSTSANGYINIWDLYKKSLFKCFYIKNSYLMTIIEWNYKYIIVADYRNNGYKIIDKEKGKVISDIKNIHNEGVICIKKIFHPNYGESLFTSAREDTIKLWRVRKENVKFSSIL